MTEEAVLMVYMTAANRTEAETLAEVLVTERAAACVNVLGPIASVYRWMGQVEHAEEVALIAKTTAGAYAQLEALVKQNHSYECPCIVAWPLHHGHAPFLDWVRASVCPGAR